MDFEAGKQRMLCRTEMNYCGMKIHGDWSDDYKPSPKNKSDGRGVGGRMSMFTIDSGDYAERERDGE